MKSPVLSLSLLSLMFSAAYAEPPGVEVVPQEGAEAVPLAPGEGPLRVFEFQPRPHVLGTSVVQGDVKLVVMEPQFAIGVMVDTLPEGIAAHLKLDAEQGLIVREVLPESPAATAGIESFDILLKVGDTKLAGLDSLQKIVRASEGQPLTVTWLHQGEPKSAEITPTKREAESPARLNLSNLKDGTAIFLELQNQLEGQQFSNTALGFGPGVLVAPDMPLSPELQAKFGSLEQRLEAIQKLLEAQHGVAPAETESK